MFGETCKTVISKKACREETCAYSSRYCWKHYNQQIVMYRLYKIENSWVDHFCSEAYKSGTKEDFELAWRTLTNVILARGLHSDWFYGGQDENHQCWWNKMCRMRESLRKRLSSRFVYEIPEEHSTEIWKTIETLIVVVDPKPFDSNPDTPKDDTVEKAIKGILNALKLINYIDIKEEKVPEPVEYEDPFDAETRAAMEDPANYNWGPPEDDNSGHDTSSSNTTADESGDSADPWAGFTETDDSSWWTILSELDIWEEYRETFQHYYL